VLRLRLKRLNEAPLSLTDHGSGMWRRALVHYLPNAMNNQPTGTIGAVAVAASAVQRLAENLPRARLATNRATRADAARSSS
jgi:hypothetical protein